MKSCDHWSRGTIGRCQVEIIISLQGGPPTSYKQGYNSTCRGHNLSYSNHTLNLVEAMATPPQNTCGRLGYNKHMQTWTYLWHHKIYQSRIYLAKQSKRPCFRDFGPGSVGSWIARIRNISAEHYLSMLYHRKETNIQKHLQGLAYEDRRQKQTCFGPGHANNLWHQLQMILQFLRARPLPCSDIWTEACATKMRSTSGCKQHASMLGRMQSVCRLCIHICTIRSYSITFKCV